MDNLKEEIAKQLQKLENMITEGSDKREIERQKEILDQLLEKYVSDL